MEGELRTLPMPKLGLTSKEATVTAWHVRPGDPVARGGLLCVVETEKAEVEVQSPLDGTVAELCVAEGETVEVGADLLRLRAAGAHAAAQASPAAADPAASPASRRPAASPAARRLARELGVDLARLQGTGPAGLIQAEDVQAAARAATTAGPPAQAAAAGAPIAPAAAPAAARTGWRPVPLTPMRRTVAGRMARSARETAPVTLHRELECSRALARLSEPATMTDVVVKAVALALAGHPGLHAQWAGEELLYPDAAEVNLAVAVPGGLVAPVLRRPAGQSVAALAAERRTLVERARAGALEPDDMAGGTFTVTNLGMYGIDAFTPIINPPQAAVLGVGRILSRPVAIGDQVAVRPTMTLSLTFDHRVVDGADAAAFLGQVAALIEDPPPDWFDCTP